MDLEGQQLLRVHVVERAQVGQFEQQLGEDGRLVGVVLGDEAPQRADQRLLQRLHRVHVLDAGAIWREEPHKGQREAGERHSGPEDDKLGLTLMYRLNDDVKTLLCFK